MKDYHYIKVVYFIVCACFLNMVSGCQKAPINGDLDGQWQVMEVYPKSTDGLTDTRIYYCFSLHTCQLSSYGDGVWTSGNMTYDSPTLILDFPYLDPNSESVKSRLSNYGISKNPVTFTIEHLDKNKLILRDGDTVVTLRKF